MHLKQTDQISHSSQRISRLDVMFLVEGVYVCHIRLITRSKLYNDYISDLMVLCQISTDINDLYHGLVETIRRKGF